jgi:hypothetical protein
MVPRTAERPGVMSEPHRISVLLLQMCLDSWVHPEPLGGKKEQQAQRSVRPKESQLVTPGVDCLGLCRSNRPAATVPLCPRHRPQS